MPAVTAAADGAAGAVADAMLFADVVAADPDGAAAAAAPGEGEDLRRLAQEPPGLGPADA